MSVKKRYGKADEPDENKRLLRDDAEEQLVRSPRFSHELKGKTPEKLIHELQVHQIELEMQAEELRNAKLELEESRDKFLDLYDFAPLGYLTLSDKALITEVNLTATTLLGVDRNRLVNTPFSKYIAEQNIDEWHWYFLNMLNQEEKRSCTLTLKRGDGSIFPARLESIRIAGSTNGIPMVRMAISDISDIRMAEKVEKDHHSLLKAILESTGSAVFSLDRKYRYTSFNSYHAMVMKQLYGADIVTGRSIFDYQSNKEEQAKTKINIDRALAGDVFTDEAFSGEEKRLRRYFEVTHRPVKDVNNNITGVVIFAHDITDRKRAEDSIKQSEERYRRVAEGLTDYLYTVNVQDGKVVSTTHGASCTAVTGYTAEEFLTDPYLWIKMVFDKDRDCVARHFNGVLSGKPVPPIEHRIVRKDGRVRWVRDTPILQLDADGSLVSYDGVIKDITERKQADDFRQLSMDVLGILNEPAELKEIVGRVLAAIKRVTKADAVGIRLKTGDDFPYFVENGFSNDFLLKENTLVARDPDGGICRDSEGNVSLECTCGLVISGKTDPKNPLFTPGGSSWTNNSFPFLKLPEKDDPRFHPRNTCIHEGYASIALIPIKKSQQQIIGILQINAFMKDCFTPDIIQSLELMGGHIGEALMRKTAEEALFKSEDQLASAIEGSGVGLWDWDVQTGKTVFNERWAEIAGYTLAELSPVSIDTWINLCHPDDLQRSDELLKKHFSKQLPMYECEARILHKDGHWVWVLDRGKVVKWDSNGLPIRMTGTHLDITERKRAEDSLKEEQQFSKLILDSLPGIFYLYTYPEHQLMRWNKQHETLMGFSADELKGKLASDWHLPELKDAVLKATQEVMDKGESSVESNLIAKDGHAIPFFLTGVRFEAQGRLYYMGTGIDITERKRAEEAVRHLTEFQQSVISNALVWLSVLDPAGKILIWNIAAAEISGYRSEEVIGSNAIWKWLYPEKEYRKQITTTINRIISEKKYLENFETIIRTKEGNEKIISWNTRGITDKSGKTADYIVIGMDVTDRHRAEEQLNKTVDELRQFNNLTVDRELRMIALKKEINTLLRKTGEPEKYRIGS